jgi:hypothetical protein
LIEITSGASWIKAQLKALAYRARVRGEDIIYIFLEKPSPGTEKSIRAAGGRVAYFYD